MVIRLNIIRFSLNFSEWWQPHGDVVGFSKKILSCDTNSQISSSMLLSRPYWPRPSITPLKHPHFSSRIQEAWSANQLTQNQADVYRCQWGWSHWNLYILSSSITSTGDILHKSSTTAGSCHAQQGHCAEITLVPTTHQLTLHWWEIWPLTEVVT